MLWDWKLLTLCWCRADVLLNHVEEEATSKSPGSALPSQAHEVRQRDSLEIAVDHVALLQYVLFCGQGYGGGGNALTLPPLHLVGRLDGLRLGLDAKDATTPESLCRGL